MLTDHNKMLLTHFTGNKTNQHSTLRQRPGLTTLEMHYSL